MGPLNSFIQGEHLFHHLGARIWNAVHMFPGLALSTAEHLRQALVDGSIASNQSAMREQPLWVPGIFGGSRFYQIRSADDLSLACE